MRLDIQAEAEKIAHRINNPRVPCGSERAVFWFPEGPYLSGSLSTKYAENLRRWSYRLVGVYTRPVDPAVIAEDLEGMV